jgi:putative transposase
MTTDWRLVEFIESMRKEYGNVGAHIIKPFLDEYAGQQGVNSLAVSTIEKVIRRRRLTFETRKRAKRKTKYAHLRTRKSPKVKGPGYIEMDSITVYVDNTKHLFMSVIDIYTRYALVRRVTSLSAVQATGVFQQFQQQSPNSVHTVQTDNGGEFLAGFHSYLADTNINHVFIYPNCPKLNGVVERFNRTIQEEFIHRNDDLCYDLERFQVKLTKYLEWYNYKRPHYALKYVSPMQFIKEDFPESG